MISIFARFIILFATARHMGPKIARALSSFSALILLIFGIYQIRLGFL